MQRRRRTEERGRIERESSKANLKAGTFMGRGIQNCMLGLGRRHQRSKGRVFSFGIEHLLSRWLDVESSESEETESSGSTASLNHRLKQGSEYGNQNADDIQSTGHSNQRARWLILSWCRTLVCVLICCSQNLD
jgi:hypothetical protein